MACSPLQEGSEDEEERSDDEDDGSSTGEEELDVHVSGAAAEDSGEDDESI